MDSVREWLGNANLTVPEERLPELLLKVKQKSIAKKGLLTEGEFREIVEGMG